MTLLQAWGATILHLLLLAPAALLVAGLGEVARARLRGMRGPGLLMPFRTIAACVGRQRVRGPETSLVTVIGPALVLTTTFAAAALVPVFSRETALAGIGDALTVAGLLTFGRLMAALLEGGEDGTAVFAEPAVLLAIFVRMLPSASAAAPIGLAALVLGALALATGPLPARRASGSDLAMLMLAAALRRLVFLSLIADCLRPEVAEGAAGWLPGLGIWAGIIIAITLASAAAEAALPPRQPRRRREALAVGLVLAVLAALVGLAEAVA